MNFFISSFRFKVACVCAFGVILSLVNAILLRTPPGEILGKYGFSMGAMLLLSIVLWRPAFTYFKADPQSLWKRWGAAGRMPSAEEYREVRFERFYPKTKYALMRDPTTGHRISTTLLKCSCFDFHKKRAPCKHMFKLACLTEASAETDTRSRG
jgi:hypothetical protein